MVKLMPFLLYPIGFAVVVLAARAARARHCALRTADLRFTEPFTRS